MNSEEFYSRIPSWFFWPGIAGSAINALIEPWLFFRNGASLDWSGQQYLLTEACWVFLLWFFVKARRNRLHRPVIQVSDEAIEVGLLWVRASSIRIPIREVVELLPSGSSRIALRMRSGKRERFSLFEVAKSQRDAVRNAIERRIPPSGA